MEAREKLIEELGFLDESSVVLDENTKKKSSVKTTINKEVPDTTGEKYLLDKIDRVSDTAALAVMDAYKKIPRSVKDAVWYVYYSLQRLGGETTMQDVKDSLKGLKEACSDVYERVYKSVLKDAKKIVPKIQTRMMLEGLEEEK